ncbi:probable E3 ubiquitin-protein ligase ARI3 [Prunus dulcis]|uniref:probable E3 ubiquitin-protein ligase ARI3 n=1 Tax=Prunus dulcis TaxID=3755 RepID=UPI0014828975|nr:probable E3 ubiquitin-protein ligase ARI3 [Prunus dulcis]
MGSAGVWGLLREETLDIWGWKVVVVGAGVAICDRRDNLIFESRKNLKSLNFAVRSRKTAELLALIDGLKEAFTLKLKRVIFSGSWHNALIKTKCEVNIITCKKLLSPELADVMIERIKESSIPVTEKVYCAFPMCSALMSKKEVLEHTKTSFVSEGGRKCMKCQLYFCVNCKVPWHYDMSCYDYQRSETNSLAEEQLLKSLAMKKLWRQCSKCKHMVELDSGCYHITCRCGHQFCYTCGAEWKNKRATCSCPLWDEHHIILP